MVFCREVYTTTDGESFSYQHREQHISKKINALSVGQEIQVSRLTLKKWSLEFVISFSKDIFGIWE
jgi:hypothetical protein